MRRLGWSRWLRAVAGLQGLDACGGWVAAAAWVVLVYSLRNGGPILSIAPDARGAPPVLSAGSAGPLVSQPPVVSSFSTASTASCLVMAEVSSTRSASRGSSYGSDTPVKPVIRPARALAYRPLRSRAAHTSTGVDT